MSRISTNAPRQMPTELESGDRMSRQEFHEIYSRMPESFRAELIGGTVYVASPLRVPHGRSDPILIALLVAYAGRTPGVEVCSNTTVLLGDDSEPQPDILLRILPEFGGQSRTTADDYLAGAPELIAEVAHSTKAIDLNAKRDDYTRHGVREYLVLSVADKRLHWFDLLQGRELQADSDGILRIRVFPGLWIDREALLTRDYRRLMDVLNQGLATSEHTAFVAGLAEARRQKGGS